MFYQRSDYINNVECYKTIQLEINGNITLKAMFYNKITYYKSTLGLKMTSRNI